MDESKNWWTLRHANELQDLRVRIVLNSPSFDFELAFSGDYFSTVLTKTMLRTLGVNHYQVFFFWLFFYGGVYLIDSGSLFSIFLSHRIMDITCCMTMLFIL